MILKFFRGYNDFTLTINILTWLMLFLQNALIHLGVFFSNIKTLLDCRSVLIILCGVLLVTV
jgi:hypothetical protein